MDYPITYFIHSLHTMVFKPGDTQKFLTMLHTEYDTKSFGPSRQTLGFVDEYTTESGQN